MKEGTLTADESLSNCEVTERSLVFFTWVYSIPSQSLFPRGDEEGTLTCRPTTRT